LDSAMVPWRARRWAVGTAALAVVVLILFRGGPDAGTLGEAVVLAVGIVAVYALFSLRWQRVALTSHELRVEDGDQMTSYPLRDVEARQYGDGARVVEAGGMPILAPISSRSMIPAVALMR